MASSRSLPGSWTTVDRVVQLELRINAPDAVRERRVGRTDHAGRGERNAPIDSERPRRALVRADELQRGVVFVPCGSWAFVSGAEVDSSGFWSIDPVIVAAQRELPSLIGLRAGRRSEENPATECVLPRPSRGPDPAGR